MSESELERAEAPASQFANFVSRDFIERELAAAQKENKEETLSLRLELAFLQETAGDEPAAAATYLAAQNAFGSREALESLARLFERHGLYHNFLPIADALMLSAETTGEELRALSLKLRYLDSQKNYEEAERLARSTCERTELDANERSYFAVAWYYFARQSNNTDSALGALELRCSLEPLSAWRSQLELERLEYASVTLSQAALAVEGMVDPARTLLGFLELVERRKEEPDANIVRAWIFQAIGALEGSDEEPLPFWLSTDRREAALALGLATLHTRANSGSLAIAIPPSFERRGDLLHWLLAKYFRGESNFDRTARELTFLLKSESRFVAELARTALRVASSGEANTRDVELSAAIPGDVISSSLRIVDAWKASDYETLVDTLSSIGSENEDVRVRNQFKAILYAALGLRDETSTRRLSSALLASALDDARRFEIATMFQTFARALTFWGWMADATEVAHSLRALDDDGLLALVRARHASGDAAGASRAVEKLADPVIAATFRLLLPPDSPRSESAISCDLSVLARQILDPEASRWTSLVGAIRSPLEVHRRLWSLEMDAAAAPKADAYRFVLGISLAIREAEMGEHHHASRALALLANQTDDLPLGARLYGTAGLLDWRSGRRKDALRAFENGALLDEASLGPLYQWVLLAESHLDPALRPIAAEGSNQLGENTTDSALRRFFLKPDESSLDTLRAIVTGAESSWVDRMAASLAVFFSADAPAKTVLTAATTLMSHSRGCADLVRQEVLRRLAGNHDQTFSFLQTCNDLAPSEASAFRLLVAAERSQTLRKEKADAWLALSNYCENEAARRDMLALSNWFGGTRSPSLPASNARISELLSSLANTEDPLARANFLCELARRFPDTTDTLRFLAEAAWMRFAGGQFQASLELFDQVLALEPRDMAAWEGTRR
ncbi:MAG: hypothetical protein KBF88_05595, partial [Polyangiaceae bacterium]|nr:hypothetical protein [Polyangiaceae bacterium]